jgi:hypothetical protein
MRITIDEWIAHYLADRGKLLATLEFLEKVQKKCDSFLCVKGSPLAEKIWCLSAQSSNWTPAHQKVVKYFFGAFVSDAQKFQLLQETDLQILTPDLENKVSQKDRYLVRTALSTEDRFILTTDGRLKDMLVEVSELRVELAEEFFGTYDP